MTKEIAEILREELLALARLDLRKVHPAAFPPQFVRTVDEAQKVLGIDSGELPREG